MTTKIHIDWVFKILILIINVMLRDKTMTATKLVLNLKNPKFSVL